MLTILSLFGRSPFAPLQAHMEKVASCVHMLPELFKALENREYTLVEQLAESISELEHLADLAKDDIRNDLSKSLLLKAIDRTQFLEILSIQDSIADMAEDAAVLLTIKQLAITPNFSAPFWLFLNKNLESFQAASLVIKEIHELLETSFGGKEAEKVNDMIEEVCFKEHEADVLQKKLLQAFFTGEEELPYSALHLWQKIFESIAAISDQSEKLAHRIRMNLQLK